jgi:hypothetical protein
LIGHFRQTKKKKQCYILHSHFTRIPLGLCSSVHEFLDQSFFFKKKKKERKNPNKWDDGIIFKISHCSNDILSCEKKKKKKKKIKFSFKSG